MLLLKLLFSNNYIILKQKVFDFNDSLSTFKFKMKNKSPKSDVQPTRSRNSKVENTNTEERD